MRGVSSSVGPRPAHPPKSPPRLYCTVPPLTLRCTVPPPPHAVLYSAPPHMLYCNGALPPCCTAMRTPRGCTAMCTLPPNPPGAALPGRCQMRERWRRVAGRRRGSEDSQPGCSWASRRVNGSSSSRWPAGMLPAATAAAPHQAAGLQACCCCSCCCASSLQAPLLLLLLQAGKGEGHRHSMGHVCGEGGGYLGGLVAGRKPKPNQWSIKGD